MKSPSLLILIAAVSLTSCTGMYKTTQTPDDVYYSPARGADEYVEAKKDNPNRYNASNYESDRSDERWLRMRSRNPYRWSYFDDYDWNLYNGYTYNPYIGYYGSGWNMYFNNFWSWNSYYNPYCRTIVVVNPTLNPGAFRNVRTVSLASYQKNNYSNSPMVKNGKTYYSPTGGGSLTPGSRYNNSNSNSNSGPTLGTSIRKAFTPSSGGYTNGNVYTPADGGTPVRSYTPSSSGTGTSSSGSSSSGGSSSGGSSGGGSVSRPGRGGGL
ncbi:MAG: hypothetical protein K2P88_13115 [Chitinophagaceae bacterium]|nr:hypothetical protein [Chitinophagaceae bacterium]